MVRTTKKQVSLANKAYPAVVVYLSALVDERGLVIEGQDLGRAVASVWGDSDYEYWLTVDRKHLDRVIAGLGRKLGHEVEMPSEHSDRDALLVDLLNESWQEGLFETDGDFRRWLNTIRVPSKFSSYAWCLPTAPAALPTNGPPKAWLTTAGVSPCAQPETMAKADTFGSQHPQEALPPVGMASAPISKSGTSFSNAVHRTAFLTPTAMWRTPSSRSTQPTHLCFRNGMDIVGGMG